MGIDGDKLVKVLSFPVGKRGDNTDVEILRVNSRSFCKNVVPGSSAEWQGREGREPERGQRRTRLKRMEEETIKPVINEG